MKDKFISEQYIDESVLAAIGSSLAMAAGPAIVSGAITGLTTITQLISQAKKKMDWKNEGCDHILDETEKIDCQILNLDAQSRDISSLNRECNKMKNPMECRQRISEEISKLRQKRVELIQRKNQMGYQ